MIKIHSERVKHHLNAGPCDCCGQVVHVDDTSYYVLAGACGLYCSEVCAELDNADYNEGEQAFQAASDDYFAVKTVDLLGQPRKVQRALFAV